MKITIKNNKGVQLKSLTPGDTFEIGGRHYIIIGVTVSSCSEAYCYNFSDNDLQYINNEVTVTPTLVELVVTEGKEERECAGDFLYEKMDVLFP